LTLIRYFVLTEGPDRPVGPIIVSKVSPHSLEIEWRAPINEGGSPVVGYVVEMTESGGGAWVKVRHLNLFYCKHQDYLLLCTLNPSTYLPDFNLA
jgi:hypothetical protein